MSKVILVPVDGSEHSKKALEFAAEYCGRFKCKLAVLHVVESPPHDRTFALGSASVTIHDSRENLEKAGAMIIDAAKKLAHEHGCPDADAKCVTGDPAKKIIEHANQIRAEMIVMGSRGLSDLKGLLVGSVSHKVNQLAPCTCVAVR